MKKRLLLFFLVALCLAVSAQAAQKEIVLSTYILGIDNYDDTSGSYALSYVLIMDCNYDCNMEDLVLLNGWIRNVVPLREEQNGNRYFRSYRLYGHLEDEVELQKYPFDTQHISIIYEHKNLEVQDLEIVAGPWSEIDARVGLPGWDTANVGASVAPHTYISNRAYYVYNHSISLKRGEIGAFFSHFFPVLLLMLILLVTYVLRLDKVQLRLAISSSILLAAMIFHLTIANKLPALGYLTFADKFMILTYIVTCVTFILNIGLLKQTEIQQTRQANKFNINARKIALYAIPLSYILLFLFFI